MYLFVKRFFDILVSSICLLILSPLLIPIMIGLKLTGEGYIFFLQRRVGYLNTEFDIYKFATMLKDSPNMPGGFITTIKDPRITPMGGFLRKSKINELPQLLNIFLGNMSFVGPRPLIPSSFLDFPTDFRAEYYKCKPGLSGIGSIIFRNEEEMLTNAIAAGKDPRKYYKEVIFPTKKAAELWYFENQTFTLDFKILIATAIVVFFPKLNVIKIFFKKLPKTDCFQ